MAEQYDPPAFMWEADPFPDVIFINGKPHTYNADGNLIPVEIDRSPSKFWKNHVDDTRS
jgi:hypothetical protein